MNSALQRWESALDTCLRDRLLTSDEEQALQALAQQWSLTQRDLTRLTAKLDRARMMSNALLGRPQPVQAAIHLKPDETCFFAAPATLHEERTSVSYVSSSRSYSRKSLLSNRITYHVGSSTGRLVPKTRVVAVSDGQFFITNKRCVFAGTRKTITVELEDLISFDTYEDGIQLHAGNSEGLQIIKFPDGDYAAAVLAGQISPADPSALRAAIDPRALGPSSAQPWHKQKPLSYLVGLVTVAALIIVAPLGVLLAWGLGVWNVPIRIAASVAGLAFFIHVLSITKDKERATQAAAPAQAAAPVPASPPQPREPTEAELQARHRAVVVQAMKAAQDTVASKQKCSSLKPDNDAWRAINAAWQLLRQVEHADAEYPKAQKLAKKLESCRLKSRVECVRIQVSLTGPKGQNGVSPRQRCDDTMRETWDLGSPLVLK